MFKKSKNFTKSIKKGAVKMCIHAVDLEKQTKCCCSASNKNQARYVNVNPKTTFDSSNYMLSHDERT